MCGGLGTLGVFYPYLALNVDINSFPFKNKKKTHWRGSLAKGHGTGRVSVSGGQYAHQCL